MTLRLIRGINLIKISFSYLISRWSKKVVHWGNPVAASIEPNNTCNLRCPECPAGMHELTRPTGFMHPDLFQSVIDQLLSHLSWLTLYFQGEPYLSRHFFDFIALARSKRIFVSTSTNGHFLDENSVRKTIDSGLNRLIISVDGADQQSYEMYRTGGDFEKVITGIRLLVSEKKRRKTNTPEIILQCLLLKSNENQLDEIRSLAKELGVDKLEFKTAQFNDYKHGNSLMPDNQRYSRYRKEGIQQYSSKNRLPDACFRMWSSCVISWDGKVVPCCFDKDGEHVMGDLTTEKFRSIWEGKSMNEFRKKILQNRKSIGICMNCSQHY
ncbi:MAG: radical SAM/SPASM domain-containing protein [Bacteroidetes bacterium]|nr:radical SAM/SPASM domain-containing protein [Bacteroidota bacterium]